MDRFVWTSGLLEINETLVIQQRGVRVYDGEEKVGRTPARPAGPRAGPGATSALRSRPRPGARRLHGGRRSRGAGERRSRRAGARDSPVPPCRERATGANAVPTLLLPLDG